MLGTTQYLQRQARIELARRSFWEFCKLMHPKFYKESRTYLKNLCDTLQDFYEGKKLVLVINQAPRTGKSFTLQHFAMWIFGRNPEEKIMTGSYNETLSTVFAKAVRNAIQEKKADENLVVYSDVFPKVKIKDGDASMSLWSLEGQYNSYLATSPKATSTGFGASLIAIDDVIKNAEEAYNENVLQSHWDWFANTILSRLEEGGKIIICSTRWSTRDLAGRILEHYASLGVEVVHINYPAKLPDGSMLCEEILSKESYELKKATIGEDIFMANYQQEPINIKGCLYTTFRTYDDVPRDSGGTPLFRAYKAYVDTADKGRDYLCAIAYGVYHDDYYVLDVIYTQDPMELTEPLTAKLLDDNNIREATIESNNGGRGFARNVERILREELRNNVCMIKTFTQTANKEAKILSNATTVMQHVVYPKDWESKWHDFAMAVKTYQREGKNAHDDAPDVLSELCINNIHAPIKINPLILSANKIYTYNWSGRV